MNMEVLFGKFPVMESEGLVLKKIESSDLQELYAIYSNERVFEYCGIIPKHNIDTVGNMIGHFERDYKKKLNIKWGIFLRGEKDKLVGIAEAMNFNKKVNMVTIGYFLAEEYWGRGIASEAVGILVKFLFEKAGINRLHAEVMIPNNASKNVLLKNSFLKEGLLRQHSLWSGKGIVDLEVYGLLMEDYKKQLSA